MPRQYTNRAVIITNGHLSDLAAARRHIGSQDLLICADAGARHAVAMGLVPDVVVGDLDSLEPRLRSQLEAAGVRFEIHPADKDKTDLQLALHLAIDAGVEYIDLLATMGGRLDQSLANLLLLTKPEWTRVQVRVIEGSETAWLAREGQPQTVTGMTGDMLSLIPLTPLVSGVYLDGVKWPLSDATLHLGDTLTISNVLTAQAAHLKIESGLALVIHRSSG